MTFKFIPTQTGCMRLEDSERLLRLIFPNYPNLQPCHPAPRLEPIPQVSKEYWNKEDVSLLATLVRISARKASQV
jgi:hypothetical protein